MVSFLFIILCGDYKLGMYKKVIQVVTEVNHYITSLILKNISINILLKLNHNKARLYCGE